MAAIQTGNPVAMSAAATERFNELSSDLALGHVKRAARTDWFVTDKDLDAAKQDALLRSALATHQVRDALNALLPTHPQYAALKAALEMTPASQKTKLDRIRLNMDRWRWLPRDLGAKYIIVNVPGFHATLVENGVNRWKQRAIAGKLSTPTPQLNATAVGVILNPWWEVPKSIEKEAAGKKGFVPVKGADGKVQRWRQPPGPTNALGQLKFVMPNSKAIYLHDTNARSRFNSRRARSATAASAPSISSTSRPSCSATTAASGRREKIQATLAAKKTVQANFVKPLPVYIVYFSAAALNDGSDRRLQGPLRPRRQGAGGARHEGWRGEPGQAEGEAGGASGDPLGCSSWSKRITRLLWGSGSTTGLQLRGRSCSRTSLRSYLASCGSIRRRA